MSSKDESTVSNPARTSEFQSEVTALEAAELDFAEQVLKQHAGDFLSTLETSTQVLKDIEVVDDSELEVPSQVTMQIEKAKFHVTQKLGGLRDFFKISFQKFQVLPIRRKVSLLGLLLSTFALLVYLGMLLKKRWITFHNEPLFVTSLEQLADEKYFFSSQDDQEPFYDSVRIVRNVFALDKVYSNLKASRAVDKGTMGAFEFAIEGVYPEVTAEIKARESEFKDLAQSVIMGFTAEQIRSQEGKAELLEQIKINFNGSLKSGLVRKVMLRNYILSK